MSSDDLKKHLTHEQQVIALLEGIYAILQQIRDATKNQGHRSPS